MIKKGYIAEAIGTFSLVFCGTGVIVINEFTGATMTHMCIAMTFGLIVMGMIVAFGEISGAHINPAVTIGFVFAKEVPWKEVPACCISQILGAFATGGILLFLFPENELLGSTLPQIDVLRIFIMEVPLTFFLMQVIINISTSSKEMGILAGIAIGGIVLLEALMACPITIASMNPGRSVSPAVVSGHLKYLWLYILATVIRALLAVTSCKLVKEYPCCDEDC